MNILWEVLRRQGPWEFPGSPMGLALWALTAEGPCSIPGWGTKNPTSRVVQPKEKKNTQQNRQGPEIKRNLKFKTKHCITSIISLLMWNSSFMKMWTKKYLQCNMIFWIQYYKRSKHFYFLSFSFSLACFLLFSPLLSFSLFNYMLSGDDIAKLMSLQWEFNEKNVYNSEEQST